jgi:hypothetical protein
MSAACSGEPISWLRLERHGLGELPAEERARIDEHLAGCAACAAAAAMARQARSLPVLPAVSAVERRRRRWRPWWLAAVPAVGAAALLALWPRPRGVVMGERLKGEEVAVELVRMRGEAVDFDPATFDLGDRFKLQVTCPAPGSLEWDVVVFQGEAVSFPVEAPGPVDCANGVPLPGAFRLEGERATVCLVWGGPVDRRRIVREGAAGLGPDSHCETLDPVPR